MDGLMSHPRSQEVPLQLYRVSRPGLALVASNTRLTPESADDVRHIVLDLSGLDYRFLEGQSLGVLPPGRDGRGRPHKLRLYSIASTRLGDDGRGTSASLCVKRVVYTCPDTGEVRRGVASNYLCDLRPGDEVAVTGPAGRTFLLPEGPDADLILIATGTGIAPFRAFLRRIYGEGRAYGGEVRLFFGVRTRAECQYLDELRSFEARPGFRLATAFSREQAAPDGRRLYVPHRMAEAADDLLDLCGRDGTHVYLCGLKGMEAGIDEAMAAQVPDWPDLRDRLASEGRYHIETY